MLRDARLLHGDAIEQLGTLADASVDTVITDPPYELGLHGLKWDSTGIAYRVDLWSEALRVMKPGAHLLAFGSTRGYHRMATAIEDAGFEIRDSIHWICNTGFPKSLDVSKALDRRRDVDREAVLRVTRFIREARDRSGKTNAEIDAAFGTNGMAGHWTTQRSQPAVPSEQCWAKLKALLGCSDEMDEEIARLNAAKGTPGEAWQQREVTGSHDKAAPGRGWCYRLRTEGKAKPLGLERRDTPATSDAREWQGWGTTLKPRHEPIVLARKPIEGRVIDNVLRFGTGAMNIDACRLKSDTDQMRRWPANVILSEEAARQLDCEHEGSSRFFFVGKASKHERNEGLPTRNPHTTVKPIALMRHLVRLVTPPNGVVLDPFAGSGTTGIAATLEGFGFIGIEREHEFVDIAEARIAHWSGLADAA